MGRKILIAAMALLPATVLTSAQALSQDTSIVKQYGAGNVQETYQAGKNFAVKVQIGTGNSASSNQSGDHNFSAIAQIGEGHTKSHSQSGNTVESSVQVSTELPDYSTSITVSNGTWSIKSSMEAN